MPMYVKVEGKGLDSLKDAISFLKSNRVLIGIPQANSSSRGEITNVELAFIHTMGSPVNRIPPRPFLEPGVEEAKDQIAGCMKTAVEAAVKGETGAAMDELEKAGLYGENAVKSYIGGGHHAPNAGITIEGGWMRNRVSGKPVFVKGKHSDVPLIDTGSLRSSITHVIEGK